MGFSTALLIALVATESYKTAAPGWVGRRAGSISFMRVASLDQEQVLGQESCASVPTDYETAPELPCGVGSLNIEAVPDPVSVIIEDRFFGCSWVSPWQTGAKSGYQNRGALGQVQEKPHTG